jgi:hypothetical protein
MLKVYRYDIENIKIFIPARKKNVLRQLRQPVKQEVKIYSLFNKFFISYAIFAVKIKKRNFLMAKKFISHLFAGEVL